MKIIFDPKLRKLAEKLGKALGIRTQELKESRTQDNEETVFVGRGMANKALRRQKTYPKCWEVGRVIDNIDYLRKVILDEKTLEKKEFGKEHRKSPEHIVTQKFDYDCGGASFCTWMIMINREDVLKTDVYRRLDVNPVDGTKSERIKEVLEEEKIPYLEIFEADLTDVENVLNNDGVVLVSYQSEGTEKEIEKLECGHYSIIFDMNEASVRLIDPSHDEEYIPGAGIGVFSMAREEFEDRWIDKGTDGTIYKKWMMGVRRVQANKVE